MNHRSIIELLKAEVVPTSGCTEPGAVALATAHACSYLSDPIDQIIVHVNPNIFKNGVAVGIPGTDQTGLHIAAALGAIKRHPEKQLMVLENVTDEDLQAAKNLVKQNIVQIEVDSSISTLWIKAQVK
ncbi:MAG: serine dehydratase subunit alpha family protein, partial [Sporomusa sp.]